MTVGEGCSSAETSEAESSVNLILESDQAQAQAWGSLLKGFERRRWSWMLFKKAKMEKMGGEGASHTERMCHFSWLTNSNVRISGTLEIRTLELVGQGVR